MTKPKMTLMYLDSDSVLGELGEPLDDERHGSLSVVSTSLDLNRLVFVRGDRLCSSVTHVVPFDLTMLEMHLEGTGVNPSYCKVIISREISKAKSHYDCHLRLRPGEVIVIVFNLRR